MRASHVFKLVISAMTIVAIGVWWYQPDSWGEVAWVCTRFAVPALALVAALIPPLEGNRYLWTIVLFGVLFAVTPNLVSDDDMIQGFLMLGIGILGCIASWVLLVRQYFTEWRATRAETAAGQPGRMS